ncbi:MAG TPA: tetratricopeptide repeat protein, partial [Alphaproteobacteria bacterium]|nr:tetratricopeptide repeat protein [Alphaproteobacteria bacterium]
TDPRHATQLHSRSGLAYMRAEDITDAEKQYGIALTLEPDDPDIWVDRATERAGNDNFWDAVSDLNHALSIEPDFVDALRLRGQCWLKLGNSKNALADFNLAEQIEADEQAKKKK